MNALMSLTAFYVYLHLGASIGLHRYFSHRSFKVAKPISYLLAFFGTLNLVGSPMFWAAIHRKHHATSDTSEDPHSHLHRSPMKLLFGLWYDGLHISRRGIGDLLEDKSLQWAHRNYFKIIFGWILFLALLDPWAPVYAYILPATAVILSLNVNLIFHHHLGYRNFDNGDVSTNNWPMFLVSFGECWHNNHHHNPSSPTMKVRWWELDPQFTIIRILQLTQFIPSLRFKKSHESKLKA